MSSLLSGLAGSSWSRSSGLTASSQIAKSDVAPQEIMRTRGCSALGPRVGKFRKTLSVVTKDSAGALLPGATVHCFATATDVEVNETVSDANDAGVEFSQYQDVGNHYCVAYKVGAPDVAGTTINSLVFR
jgi:hypothetical protein